MGKETANINISLPSIVGPRASGLFGMLLESGFAAMLEEDEKGMPFVNLFREEGEPVTLLYQFMGDEDLMNYYLVASATVDVKGVSEDRISLWRQTTRLCTVTNYDGDSVLIAAHLPEYGGISDNKTLLLFLREVCNEIDSLSALSKMA